MLVYKLKIHLAPLMSIKHTTASRLDNHRLHYREHYEVKFKMVGGHYKGDLFIPPKAGTTKGLHRLYDTDNILAEIRLYRFMVKSYQSMEKTEDMSGMVEKVVLMNHLFEDAPTITKTRVGRLLRLILPYHPNFQQNPLKKHDNPRTVMNWRWTHPADVIFGLEHLMVLWLPVYVNSDGGNCRTGEDYSEELQVLVDQSPKEDFHLIQRMVTLGLT